MSGSAVIGALHVVLDADNDNFDGAIDQSRSKIGELETALASMGDKLREVGQKVSATGAAIAAAFTVSFSAVEVTAVRTASTFEGAMNRVRIALGNIDPAQLKALEAQARSMGPAVGQSASDAAAGLEALATKGIGASDILGGAFAASLKLAAIGQTDLAPATQLTASVMQKFGIAAGELPPVVDRITGALQAGHGGLAAYGSAVTTAGDQAVTSGVRFEDFNTVIAATGLVLQKGESAGGSFKAFLAGIQAPTDNAKKWMKELGVSFTDASGKIKPLGDIARTLQKTFTGLSEAARSKLFTEMFGTAGMDTAISLMRLGKQGYLDLQQTIGKTDASKEAAVAQEGYAAAVKRLSAAWSELKISIGQSGLLDIATSFVNSLTRMVSWLDSASPALKRVGAAFAGVATVIGPLLAIMGGALYFAFGVWLRSLGPITSGIGALGWAISAVLEPIGTLISAFIRLGGAFAASAGLRGIGVMFAEVLGPIGWAITAFILFKDSVIPALRQVWDFAVKTLGPPLAALLTQVGALFSGLSSGPVATAISTILDVLGVLAAFVVEKFGAAFVEALSIVVGVLSTLVSMISDAVTVISDLLHGDFAGAWSAAEQIVSDAVQGVVNIIKGLFPGAAEAIQVFYDAAKSWLVDGVGGVFNWVGGLADWLVTSIGNAFPKIVQIARDVYEGIKNWLVDHLGPVGDWIASWAGNVVARFNETKKALGLGGVVVPNGPAAPKAPVAPPRPSGKVTNNYMPKSDDGKDGKEKKDSHGITAEELALQKEIEAATLRGDVAHARALQDALDLSKQIRAYEKTGLSNTEATARATRDMNAITAARASQDAKAITEQQRSLAIDIAKLDHNTLLEESLTRQAELQQRIDFFKSKGKTDPAAQAAAQKEQDDLDAARERVRARWFSDDADARALRLAQLRGDSDEEIRQLQRVIDVKKRSRELEDEHVTPTDALAQANEEADQQHQADLQSKFRDIFKGGFKAALDGGLGDWFQNWWKDRVAKGMEQALNSLADAVAKLFSQIGSNNGSSGGGFFGSLGSAIGGLFGNKGVSFGGGISEPASIGGGSIQSALAGIEVPHFATGGGFTVGGKSGIDQNLVSMRLSKGEMVDIRHGNDNGPGGSNAIYQTVQVQGGVDLATRSESYRLAAATRAATMMAMNDMASRRG